MDLKRTNLALLPYIHTTIIKDITQKINTIDLMLALLHELKNALYYFKNNNLELFDAQVGETLCQIRAYKIYYLATYSSSFIKEIDLLKIQVDEGIEKLSLIAQEFQNALKLHKSERNELIRAPLTLGDFFKEYECIIALSDDALFLFSSFFLCKYHVVDGDNIPTALDFPTIQKKLGLSRSFAKKLGHYHQKSLSELSCNFIFNLMKELPNSQELQYILPLLQHQADEGRMVLPCYCVTEIIVLHMIEKRANMVLLVDVINSSQKIKMPFFLKGSKEKNNFELLADESFDNRPCLVMYGSRILEGTSTLQNTQEQLLSIGVKEVILSNNATHPQYSGLKLSAYRDNHYTTLISENKSLSLKQIAIAQKRAAHLLSLKHLAKKIGCTRTNPALFVLQHIYCSTLKSYKTPTIETINASVH